MITSARGIEFLLQSKIKVTALKDKSSTTLELFMITPSIAKLTVL